MLQLNSPKYIPQLDNTLAQLHRVTPFTGDEKFLIQETDRFLNTHYPGAAGEILCIELDRQLRELFLEDNGLSDHFPASYEYEPFFEGRNLAFVNAIILHEEYRKQLEQVGLYYDDVLDMGLSPFLTFPHWLSKNEVIPTSSAYSYLNQQHMEGKEQSFKMLKDALRCWLMVSNLSQLRTALARIHKAFNNYIVAAENHYNPCSLEVNSSPSNLQCAITIGMYRDFPTHLIVATRRGIAASKISYAKQFTALDREENWQMLAMEKALNLQDFLDLQSERK